MKASRLSVASVLALSASLALAKKTSIYIDQIPLYSSLEPCAQDRMSAIIRAQASGCGDERQLTSFSCFCIDNSSLMSSIISTAVEASCAATATQSVTATTPMPQVSSALELFHSYCARSTELPLYTDNATAVRIITITASASLTSSILNTSILSTSILSTTVPSSAISATTTTTGLVLPSGNFAKASVPIAAIAAPVTIGIFLIGGGVGLLFYLRRRKQEAERERRANGHTKPTFSRPPKELLARRGRTAELEAQKHRFELGDQEIAQTERAELDGIGVERKF
ncbi:hypothetical protein BS50DRAFT_581715 [Corynespora cassiicola Philippines]|uniref:Extracellular membrane protein CFEM domain-containing protein n=1 Tax=Corynespora cassiicola Philippines TaxID=1448308 RepID=A0A2T2PBE3_CORCC|nr:hypothetical protein BS50DRAFT_581715 [Corynespora cassiicola Philippines]